jgi:predicted transposase/invertase (TIGR01784 family)
MADDEKKDIHQPHDKGYKFLLSSKKVFIELLRSFVDQGWVDQIDETQLIRVEKSFILQDFHDKEADLVYRMTMNDQEVIFYVLMEFQSSVDFQMPYRLLLYMTEIWRSLSKNTEGQKTERKEFQLPVIVPIVVYNGKSPWTAHTSYKETLSGFEWFDDHVLDFKYILIDVNRYKKEDLLKLSNLIGAVFLLDQHMSTKELQQRLLALVDVMQGLDEEEFQMLKTWVIRILSRGLSKKDHNQVTRAIEYSNPKEAEEMISNLEETLKGIKKEVSLEIAERMLKNGVSTNNIVEYTGLSIEEIEKLKNDGNSD